MDYLILFSWFWVDQLPLGPFPYEFVMYYNCTKGKPELADDLNRHSHLHRTISEQTVKRRSSTAPLPPLQWLGFFCCNVGQWAVTVVYRGGPNCELWFPEPAQSICTHHRQRTGTRRHQHNWQRQWDFTALIASLTFGSKCTASPHRTSPRVD